MDLRETLEVAIDKLQILVDNDTEEAKFQEWFSINPIVFDVLGYKQHIGHPELLYEGKKYIPDFMAQTLAGEWEIIELKTADANILKDTDRRHAFFAESEKNLSQCREYSLVFYDTACRERFDAEYETTCHKTPSVKLIIGRREGLNRPLVSELLSGRVPRISIVTYDDVIDQLKARHEILRGIVEKPNGIYILYSITPIKSESVEDLYVADICQHGGKSRVRLFTSGRKLVMQTDDATGIMVSRMKCRLPDLYSTSIYEMEVSPSQYETGITLLIDGEVIFETTVRNTDFDFSDKLDMVLGSDQNGDAHSSMMVGGGTVATNIPSETDKAVLREYFANIRDEHGKRHVWELIGHKFLHNEGHLTLGSRKAHSTNLIQEVEEFRPILRYL